MILSSVSQPIRGNQNVERNVHSEAQGTSYLLLRVRVHAGSKPSSFCQNHADKMVPVRPFGQTKSCVIE